MKNPGEGMLVQSQPIQDDAAQKKDDIPKDKAQESLTPEKLEVIKQRLISDIEDNILVNEKYPEYREEFFRPEVRQFREVREAMKKRFTNDLKDLVKSPMMYFSIDDHKKEFVRFIFEDPSELGLDPVIQGLARRLFTATRDLNLGYAIDPIFDVAQFADLQSLVSFPREFIDSVINEPDNEKTIKQVIATGISELRTVGYDEKSRKVAREIISKLSLPETIVESPEIQGEAVKAFLRYLGKGKTVAADEVLSFFPNPKIILDSSEVLEAAPKVLAKCLRDGNGAAAYKILELFSKRDIFQNKEIEDEFLLYHRYKDQDSQKVLDIAYEMFPRLEETVQDIRKRAGEKAAKEAEPYLETELSPEVEAQIMKKVQDIDANGTAYSTIGADNSRMFSKEFVKDESSEPAEIEAGRKEVLRSVLDAGLLGFDSEGKYLLKRGVDYKRTWVERVRKMKDYCTVWFNIVGEISDIINDDELEIERSGWSHKQDSITIIFDLKHFKTLNSYGKRDGSGSSFGGHVLYSRVHPKYFQGIALGDPSYNGGIFMKQRVEWIVKAMKEVDKDHAERLVPIYDIHGNLLWPKRMSYEEVKKMVKEREAVEKPEAE